MRPQGGWTVTATTVTAAEFAPERFAVVLAWLAEDWLRRLARDGSPPPAPEVVAVLTRLALAAPEYVAAKCPLLRAAGADVRLSCSAPGAEAPLAVVGLPGASSFCVGVPETARRLGVSRRYVRWLCKAGRLRSRLGPDGRWRIDAAAVEAYRRRTHASRARATAQ